MVNVHLVDKKLSTSEFSLDVEEK
jgi:hypothetical protein